MKKNFFDNLLDVVMELLGQNMSSEQVQQVASGYGFDPEQTRCAIVAIASTKQHHAKTRVALGMMGSRRGTVVRKYYDLYDNTICGVLGE